VRGLAQLFDALGSTDELMEATGDRAWLGAMVEVEAALARAEAAAGLIPAAAGAATEEACPGVALDAVDVARRGRPDATPVIALVAAIREAVGEPHGRWVHYGATSQDIVDTAAMVVTCRALEIIQRHNTDVVVSSAALAARYRNAPMMGRTLLQHAAPVTFGLKAAGWLVAAMEAGDALSRLRPRLAVQLGGPVGTLASLGDAGLEVVARMAVALDLSEPVLPWHAARGRMAEIASTMAVAAGTCAKVATDVVLMSQSEVAEVEEAGGGASSSMPHKRNPAAAVTALASARRAHGLAATLLGAMAHEHERAAGAWQAEWGTLSALLVTAGGAVAATDRSLAGLQVNAATMAERAGGGPAGIAGLLVDRALEAYEAWRTP
jgi:3-carboxy-cis,cis-muconate cycloisomerase